MKAEEMGDLLAGLAGSLDGYLKKAAVDDLKLLAGFLRDKGKTSVANVIKAFDVPPKPAKKKASKPKIEAPEAIAMYQDLDRRAASLPVEDIRAEFKRIGALPHATITKIAASVGYPKDKRKGAAVARLLERLERKRISAQQVGQIGSA